MKAPPTLVPSSTVCERSIPSSASSPLVSPVPMVSPTRLIFPANHALPVLSHHSLNGSAMSFCHEILIFPKKSAFLNSSLENTSLALSAKAFTFSIAASIQSLNVGTKSSTHVPAASAIRTRIFSIPGILL